MSKTILRAVILLVAGAVLLCGCEKKENTPQKKYKEIKTNVIFYPDKLEMKVNEKAKVQLIVDYKEIDKPSEYNIQFSSSNENMISVDKDGILSSKMVDDISKADSVVYISLYCESKQKIFKDTMKVKVLVPLNIDCYEKYDLDGDNKISVYESARIVRIDDSCYIVDSVLVFLPGVVYINNYFSTNNMFGKKSSFDFGKNKNLSTLIFKNWDAFVISLSLFELKFSNNPKLENLTIDYDGHVGSYLATEFIDFSHCPNLLNVTIIRAGITSFSSLGANKIEKVTLHGTDLLQLVDLSNCNDLTVIDIDAGSNVMKLILSPIVFEKYKNGSPDLTVSIPAYATVTKTE